MSRAVATSTKKAAPADHEYLELVKRFALRPIRTKDQFAAAGEILDRLIGRDDLTPGQRDYVAALVRFVQDYENEHVRKTMERLTPLDLLKHLVEENEMSTTDLGYILGSRGLASEVLNGKRGLSKRLIQKLAERFQVDPALFLDAHENQKP